MDYNHISGELIWKVSRRSRKGKIKPGAVAGTIDPNGHRIICIDQVRYMAHRLAWFHHYGIWPIGELDHKDMAPDNNWIANLKDVGLNRSLQRANQKVRRDSSTGLKGVKRGRKGKFVARIAGRHLGTFSSAEAAHAVYVAEAEKLFGEFARAA